jgi:Flp pilus assembly protein TadB
MAPVDRQHYALQTIFSFFLGLMVLAFIGVGVNTFYPSPSDQFTLKQQELQRQLEAAQNKAPQGSYTATQQAAVTSLQTQVDDLNNQQAAAEKDWAKITSIILVIFATIVMAISLVRSDQLRALSNGLLLGGLFTMLYGTGWVIFSGNSTARFAVISFALLVSIALGYVKFVRQRANRVAGSADPVSAPSGEALAGIEARVEALEERASAAAAALGGESHESR